VTDVDITGPEVEIEGNDDNDTVGDFKPNEEENESKFIFMAGIKVEIKVEIDIKIKNE
jgi:hypothetical protein